MSRRVKVLGCVLLCAVIAGLFLFENAAFSQPIPFAFWKKGTTAPDPCSGKAIGQAGAGTLALCAGGFNGGKYMTTTSNSPAQLQWAEVQPCGPFALSATDGAGNTAALAAMPAVYPAADYCANLIFGGYTDWHLPAKDELNSVLYTNRVALGVPIPVPYTTSYWSSTDYGDWSSWSQDFYNGSQNYGNAGWTKGAYCQVRCVRRY